MGRKSSNIIAHRLSAQHFYKLTNNTFSKMTSNKGHKTHQMYNKGKLKVNIKGKKKL